MMQTDLNMIYVVLRTYNLARIGGMLLFLQNVFTCGYTRQSVEQNQSDYILLSFAIFSSLKWHA